MPRNKTVLSKLVFPDKLVVSKPLNYSLGALYGPLTFWRRNYFFFLILAHPVYKM